MIQYRLKIPKIEKLNYRNQMLFQKVKDKQKFCYENNLYTREYGFDTFEKIKKKIKMTVQVLF
tara:strand:+ start:3527 stop:3715 length:189 start_codon:yes stop_codon:yes gene_type:complete